MPHWNATLHIKEAWQKAQEAEIAPSQLAAVIRDQLNQLPPRLKKEAEEWISKFDLMAQDENLEDAEFNYEWDGFYAWADRADIRIWVETF